ncbi:hypothetical protein ACOZE3_29075 [Streptomyces cinereoruber]|uniref:hypothetical protein n=1 Tax=Streptomyces cinereoruber TaxID=67260 RepID=UPI003BF47311
MIAPEANHCTKVAARCTLARAASSVSGEVGVWPPWREVWPSHRARISASAGAIGSPDPVGITQGQVSRKQSGTALWSLDDLDRLSIHYGIPVPDLLCGADHAVRRLPATRRAAHLGGAQTVIAFG